jgi:hypothetical protein
MSAVFANRLTEEEVRQLLGVASVEGRARPYPHITITRRGRTRVYRISMNRYRSIVRRVVTHVGGEVPVLRDVQFKVTLSDLKGLWTGE